MKEKKIMILGGGPNQFPFVKASRELGLYTILCDYAKDNMSRDYADKFYLASILDKEEILSIARKENIDGIFTSSEPGMYVATYVAKLLNLPSIDHESFLTLVDKSRMKKFLEEEGFNYPNYISINENYCLEDLEKELGQWNSELIVKPIDSSGSRGVNRVKDLEDLDFYIREALGFSKQKKVIIEEYIHQKYDFMIGGDIFVLKGKVVFWGLMNSMRNMALSDLVPTGTSFPTYLTEEEIKQVKEAIERVIDLLKIDFGPINIEIMFDKKGRLFINELNPRNGGNKIPEILLRATGFNFYENGVLGACNLLDMKEYTYDSRYLSTYMIHSGEPGILEKIEIDDRIRENILDLTLTKEEGDKVDAFTSADKRLGIAFLEFNNYNELKEKMDKINELIRVSLKVKYEKI